MSALCQKRASSFLTSRPVIGATDRSNVALYGTLQDLLGARMDHPFEVVTVHPIEREGHQRSTDRTDGLFGKRDEVRNAAHEREGFTIQVRDGHVGPPAPAAQCSIAPPGKCPPPRTSVIPFCNSNLSPCQNLMQLSGCLTHSESSAWRWTGTFPNARLQSTSVV